MARPKLPGRSLEAPGNRGPRGMIITGATRAQNSAYGLLRASFGATGPDAPVDFFIFLSVCGNARLTIYVAAAVAPPPFALSGGAAVPGRRVEESVSQFLIR